MASPSARQNPFRFGQVVERDAYCPRTDLEHRLDARIRRGQNTVILGQRRVGKTSLVWRVTGARRTWRVWYVDCLGIKTGQDLLARGVQALTALESQTSALERILKALPRVTVSVAPDPVTGLPTLSPSIAADAFHVDHLAGLLGVAQDMASRHKLVAVFDEFQDVQELPDSRSLLSVMRGRIQFMTKTSFVFAGSVRNRMWSLFADADSPLYKSAELLEVAREDFDDLPGFLAAHFRATGKDVAPELLTEVFRICDGVPGDLQQLCAALWDVTPGDQVTPRELGPALEVIFRNESRAYESIVTELPAQQLKVLAVLARKGGQSPLGKEFLTATGIVHSSSVKRALTRLCERRILFRTGSDYRFSNPFLALWLRHKGYS